MICTATDTPNARAEALTGRNYISYSALSAYQSCPLRYYFRYVLGLPEDTVSAALVFGGAIHRAVEHHFRELLAGNSAPDLDSLLAEYNDAWQDTRLDCVSFNKGDDFNTLGRLADRMLRAFQASDFAKPNGTIIGVEEEFRGEIVPGCPDLLARVDLVIDRGDELAIVDLKTARSRWSHDQADDASEQLLLYSELVKRLAPEKSVRLEFAVITKTKEPVVDIHSLPVDPHRVERTKRIVERVWQSIESGTFYPAPSPMNCPSCPFREPCRSWSG